MLLLGGFTLNIVVCGIIFRPLEGDGAKTKADGEGEEDKSLKEEEVHLLVNDGSGDTTTAAAGDKSAASKAMTAKEGMEIISSLQELNALPKGTTKLVDSSRDKTDSATTSTPTGDHGDTSSSNHIEDNALKNDIVYKKERTSSEPFADSVPLVQVINESSLPKKPEVAVANGEGNIAQISASQRLGPTTAGGGDLDIALLARSDGAIHHRRLQVNAQGGSPDGSRPVSRHASKSQLAPLQRKDIFYSGNLLNIPLYRSQPDLYHKQVASSSRSSSVDYRGIISRTGINEEEDDSSRDRQEQTGCAGVWGELIFTLKDMMSMELLKNPVFLMFGISNFFTSIGFNMPFIFLPDR